MKNKQFVSLAICLIILLSTIIYSNSFSVPFLFDDSHNIENPNLRITELNYENFTKAISGGTLSERPVSNFSFALNYYFGEYRVQGYHLVNLFIHICTAIFLYYFLKLTLSLRPNSKLAPHAEVLALLASLLWTCHPLATQSVTYIVQRMNSMGAMFFLLSLLFYAQARVHQNGDTPKTPVYLAKFLLSMLFGLLALGSKENTATLLLIIPLYEWFFFQNLSWGWLKRKAIYVLFGLFAFLTAGYLYMGKAPWLAFVSQCSTRDFTALERLMTQFRVIVHYMGLLIYPEQSRLVFDYDFLTSTSLTSPPTTLLSLLFIVFVLVATCFFARKYRVEAFCVLWFFLNLSVESSVICLEMVFEHRTYLPAMGFYLFLTIVFWRFFNNIKAKIAFLVAITLVFSYWTFKRNQVWQDPVVFWQDSIDKSPLKSRPYANLGYVLSEAGQLEQAEEAILESLRIKPRQPRALNNLGIIKLKQFELREAEEYFQKSLAADHDYLDALYNLGMMYDKQGRYDEARELFEIIWQKTPEKPLSNKLYGNALLRNGMLQEAVVHLDKALEQRPNDIGLLSDLAEAHIKMNQIDEAITYLRNVTRLEPNSKRPHYNLAMLYTGKGMTNQALKHYTLAIDFQEEVPPIRYNYANLLFRIGQHEAAVLQYEQYLENETTIAKAYNNLGLIYAQGGELESAREYFIKAVTILPEFKLAQGNLHLVENLLSGDD